MATREELYQALRNADASGDAEGARKLAAYIQSMPSDQAKPAQESAKPEKGFLDSAVDFVKKDLAAAPGKAADLIAGGVRGAGSIGSTLLAPYDMAKDALAGKGLSLESNRQRRADIDAGLQSMGADTNSTQYQVGKLGGEVAGTAGVGPVLGLGAKAVGASPAIVNALTTGGFRAGGTPGAANLLTRILGGATTGGASAGMIDPRQAGTGAVVGGVLPAAAVTTGKVSGAIGNAVRGGDVAPEVKSLADRAGELGIDIPADRLTNSKPLNALASSLNYVPFSGRAATEAGMQNQLNRALSRTFGQDSDNVTMALRKAQSDLGGKFDQVLQANKVNVDKQFIDELTQAANRANSELGSDGARIINNQVDEILAKAGNGQIDGQAAYNIKRTLDRIGKRNSPEGYYALDLKNTLMGALDRSLGPDEAAAFAATRKQYGNMLSLQKLAQNGAEGDVSIARLANMKNINNKDLQELADISAQFLKPREGQHGAMQRAVAGLGVSSMGGIPALVGGATAGRGINMLLNSQMARNAVLGTAPGAASPAVENALSKLLPLTYRTAPELSAR